MFMCEMVALKMQRGGLLVAGYFCCVGWLFLRNSSVPMLRLVGAVARQWLVKHAYIQQT